MKVGFLSAISVQVLIPCMICACLATGASAQSCRNWADSRASYDPDGGAPVLDPQTPYELLGIDRD